MVADLVDGGNPGVELGVGAVAGEPEGFPVAGDAATRVVLLLARVD